MVKDALLDGNCHEYVMNEAIFRLRWLRSQGGELFLEVRKDWCLYQKTARFWLPNYSILFL